MGRKTAKHSNRQNKTKRKQLKYKKSRRGGGKTPTGSRLNPKYDENPIEPQPQIKNKGPTHNFLGPPIKKGTMKSKKKSGSQSSKPPLNAEQLKKIANQISENQDRARSHLKKKSEINGDNIPLNKMLGKLSYKRSKSAFDKEKANAACNIL